MKKNAVILLMLLANFALADEVRIPADFLYQDNIIDPNCILESNVEKDINLEKCSKHVGKKITNYFFKDEFFGYHYLNIENNFLGFISYKYLGKVKNMHVVEAQMIGGAVSRLNYINYFQVHNDTLKLIKRGPSGDRSFGGISNAKIENDSILYDLALTTKLFIVNFGKEMDVHYNLQDLADCAICYFAKVHYHNDQIEEIRLNKEIINYQDTKLQKCFNNIHQSYIDTDHLKLTKKEANEFVDKFIAKCLK